MHTKRIKRVNSLLKEVISDVVRHHVRNPDVSQLTTITEVATSKDLSHAKVSVSIIGSNIEKEQTLNALNSAAGYISVLASKQVNMRYFPSLQFKLDHTADAYMEIESLLQKIHKDNETRNS